MLRPITIVMASLLACTALAAEEVRPPILPPRAALEQCISGKVKVEITFGPAGAVRSARIIESSPKEIFDETVLKAVRQWRLDPAQHPEGSKDTQLISIEVPPELCPKKK